MFAKTALTRIRAATSFDSRNFGVMVPAMQKASDPIQQLFLDKIREYKSKSKNDSFVDPTPAIQEELKSELERVARQCGGGKGVDMTKFPEFKFEEPKIEPISFN